MADFIRVYVTDPNDGSSKKRTGEEKIFPSTSREEARAYHDALRREGKISWIEEGNYGPGELVRFSLDQEVLGARNRRGELYLCIEDDVVRSFEAVRVNFNFPLTREVEIKREAFKKRLQEKGLWNPKGRISMITMNAPGGYDPRELRDPERVAPHLSIKTGEWI